MYSITRLLVNLESQTFWPCSDDIQFCRLFGLLFLSWFIGVISWVILFVNLRYLGLYFTYVELGSWFITMNRESLIYASN